MNLHRWFAAVFVILALAGCVQGATGPGQASHAPDNSEDTHHDRGGNGGGSGDGM